MQRARLEGSTKQVSWATDIRERMISDIDRDLGRIDLWLCEKTVAPEDAEGFRHLYGKTRDFLCRQTSARFFIENRQVGVAYFYETMRDVLLEKERG